MKVSNTSRLVALKAKSINKDIQYASSQEKGDKMVLVGKPGSLKKRKVGRPTPFETQLEMAKISWAPVLECLSLLDAKEYRSIEDLPIPKSTYNIDLGTRVIDIEKGRPKKAIHWITGEQIKIIHDDLITTFGGEKGIADASQLDALIDRAKNSMIFGHDPLETIVHKAAFLMHSLLLYHQFVDGQKRTGVSTAFILLGLNGYTLWSRNVLEEVHYCIDTTLGHHDVDDIATWLSNHIWDSRGLSKQDTIKMITKTTDLKIQCTNSKCRGFLSPKAYRVKCAKCGREYELTIGNVVVSRGITQHVSYNIGLHNLEESELVKSGVISVKKEK